MDLSVIMLVVLWIGLTAYVLFGGADFGGGVWDLLAGSAEEGRDRHRALREPGRTGGVGTVLLLPSLWWL